MWSAFDIYRFQWGWVEVSDYDDVDSIDDDDDDDDDGMERIRSGVPLIFVCPTAGTLPSNSFPLASAPQPRHFIHLIQSTLSSISSSNLSSTHRPSLSSISSFVTFPKAREGVFLSTHKLFLLKVFWVKGFSVFKVSSKWTSQVINLVFGLALGKALVPFRHDLGFSANAHRHQVPSWIVV